MTAYPHPVPFPNGVIYRRVSIGKPAFDRLKHWHRHLEQQEQKRLTNGDVLDRLIMAVPAPPAPDTRNKRD